MNWQRRLREMVLAGGALVAAACDGSTSAQSDAASSEPAAEGGDATAPGDDGSNFVCCNASPDPCCTCTGVIDDSGPSPCAACQEAGGTWDPHFPWTGPWDPLLPYCEFEASDVDAALDGSLMEAEAADACAPSGCASSCPAGTHDVSSIVNGCIVWQCCVSDDAVPEAATDAAADASAE